jgi:hypothetical protein
VRLEASGEDSVACLVCLCTLRDSHSIIVVTLVSAPSFVETVVRKRSEGESELQQQTTDCEASWRREGVSHNLSSSHQQRQAQRWEDFAWSVEMIDQANTSPHTRTHARTHTDTRVHAQHILTHTIEVAERCARGGVRERRAPRERQPLFFDDSQNTHTHHHHKAKLAHTAASPHTKAVEQTLPTMAHGNVASR